MVNEDAAEHRPDRWCDDHHTEHTDGSFGSFGHRIRTEEHGASDGGEQAATDALQDA